MSVNRDLFHAPFTVKAIPGTEHLTQVLSKRQVDSYTVPELNYLHFTAKNNRNKQDPSNHDMDELLFEIAFSGQIHDDAKLDEVKARIAKMFKADEVTITRLFSGERIVIKKNLTAEAADKYSIAFAKAGAICELELMPESATPPAPADGQAATKTPSSAWSLVQIKLLEAIKGWRK